MPIEISGGGAGGGGSGTVTNVSSANTAIAVANPTTTPVLTVATLDVLATDGPPAASVPMNTQKLTGLAAGTTAGDSVRYEQALLSGAVTAADSSIVVGGTGVAPTIRTNTLDVIAADHAPAADWSNNSHKITGLANGTASSDAAAFGQLPPLTTVDAHITSPVTIVNANTFYDGPSASFATGTWLIVWKLGFQVLVVTNQTYAWNARLWDGTTIYDEVEVAFPNTANLQGWATSASGVAIVTLGSTTTLKLSGADQHGSSAAEIISDVPDNSGTTHTASRLVGLRIA